MKIGIFGGAFNPVHTGHIDLADACYKEIGLDKLIFIPTSIPPHKSNEHLACENDRIKMLELAIDNRPYEISTIEFEREAV